MADTPDKPMSKAERTKRNVFSGGVKTGIAMAIDALKLELSPKHHPKLNRLKRDLSADHAYIPNPNRPSGANYKLVLKDDPTEREDYRHPNDFDPDAHRGRYNYDEDWNSDDY